MKSSMAIHLKCMLCKTPTTSLCIYTEPQKETLQNSLQNYLTKCDYITFVHLVKVVRVVFLGQMPNLKPVK